MFWSKKSQTRQADMQADAIATPAGKPSPRITRRALDSRHYVIDCAPLLREHELLIKVSEVRSTGGAVIGEVRTRLGRFLLAEIKGGAAGSEATLSVVMRSTFGVVSAEIGIKTAR
jgi:hypothetical protein